MAPATFSNGWLNFELSVLRRLKFGSIALPFTGEPALGVQLKHWQVRIAANDLMTWAFIKSTALLENNTYRLSSDDLETVIEDAYVPRDRLDNPTLLNWFNPTDAWWFDTVRFNAERLDAPYKRALALTLGMMVGDYVLSFDDTNRHLREPASLSRVFRRLAELLPYPHDNSLRSKASNQDVRAFLAERRHSDLMFLRLPPFAESQADQRTAVAWREEWLHGGNDFWPGLEERRAGRLGASAQSKQQYLGFLEDLLHTAAHIPGWAVALVENGFISAEELVETVGRVRKVDAIYEKDFSDLLGVRAAIVTAQG